MANTMTAPTTVRLSEELQEGLSLFANLTKRSKSHIINKALKAYLESKSAYLKDLNEAMESIETQPTYKAKNVFDWMKTWGTEQERPLKDSDLLLNSK